MIALCKYGSEIAAQWFVCFLEGWVFFASVYKRICNRSTNLS